MDVAGLLQQLSIANASVLDPRSIPPNPGVDPYQSMLQNIPMDVRLGQPLPMGQMTEDRTYSMIDVEENPISLHQTPQLYVQPCLPTDILPLNVGGRFFQTTRGTLTSESNSKLAIAFADTNLLAPAQDANGNYFIDRDPNVFEVVLRYLRSGTVTIPPNSAITREVLLEEAKYFNLETMVRILDKSRLRQEWRLVESTYVQASDGVRYVGISDVEIKGLVWDGENADVGSTNILIAPTGDAEAGSARAKYESVMTLETMKQLRLLATASISAGQAAHKEKLKRHQLLVSRYQRDKELGRRPHRPPPPPGDKPNPLDLGILESSIVAKSLHPNPLVRSAPRDPEVLAMKEHLKEKAYPNGWKVVSFGRFLKTKVRHQSVVVLLRRETTDPENKERFSRVGYPGVSSGRTGSRDRRNGSIERRPERPVERERRGSRNGNSRERLRNGTSRERRGSRERRNASTERRYRNGSTERRPSRPSDPPRPRNSPPEQRNRTGGPRTSPPEQRIRTSPPEQRIRTSPEQRTRISPPEPRSPRR